MSTDETAISDWETGSSHSEFATAGGEKNSLDKEVQGRIQLKLRIELLEAGEFSHGKRILSWEGRQADGQKGLSELKTVTG